MNMVEQVTDYVKNYDEEEEKQLSWSLDAREETWS